MEAVEIKSKIDQYNELKNERKRVLDQIEEENRAIREFLREKKERLDKLENEADELKRRADLMFKQSKSCSFCGRNEVYCFGLCRNCYSRFLRKKTVAYTPKPHKKEKESVVQPWYIRIFDDCAKIMEYDGEPPEGLEETICFLLGNLRDREEEVLSLRYQEGKSLSDIADRFGLTKERIRQIQKKALLHMSQGRQGEILKNGVQKSVREEAERAQRMAELAKNEKARRADILTAADEPVANLDLSVRAYNCLVRNGIKTGKEAIEYDESVGLMRLRNCGKGTYDEIIEKLARYGYTKE